jgi:hypothetical protein
MNKLNSTWLVTIIFSIGYLWLYFDRSEDVHLICSSVFLAASFVINAIEASKKDDKKETESNEQVL